MTPKPQTANFIVSAIAPLIAAVACSGCGGGGGGGGSASAPTPPVTFAANSIVYGIANGQSSNYNVNEISPTTPTPQTVISNVPGSVLLFALNPNTAGQFVFAADPTGAGSYGIYASTSLSTSGATQLVSPSYSYVSSLTVTEDGTHIVFSATDVSGASNLFVMPMAGGAPTLYGLSDGSTVSAVDSNTIAYVAPVGTSGNDQVFTRSLAAGASGATVQLTSDVANHALPAFSRDGTRLAYWELVPGSNALFVETLATTATISMPTTANITPQGEAFSADGTSVAVAGAVGTAGNLSTQPSDGSASPTTILSSSSLLGNYGIYWTDANGRAIAGIQGMSSSSRRRKK